MVINKYIIKTSFSPEINYVFLSKILDHSFMQGIQEMELFFDRFWAEFPTFMPKCVCAHKKMWLSPHKNAPFGNPMQKKTIPKDSTIYSHFFLQKVVRINEMQIIMYKICNPMQKCAIYEKN